MRISGNIPAGNQSEGGGSPRDEKGAPVLASIDDLYWSPSTRCMENCSMHAYFAMRILIHGYLLATFAVALEVFDAVV